MLAPHVANLSSARKEDHHHHHYCVTDDEHAPLLTTATTNFEFVAEDKQHTFTTRCKICKHRYSFTASDLECEIRQSNREMDPITRQPYAQLEVFTECKNASAPGGCAGTRVHYYNVDMTYVISSERYLRVCSGNSSRLLKACRAAALHFLSTSDQLTISHRIKCCSSKSEKWVAIPSFYSSKLLTVRPVVFSCLRKPYQAYFVRCPLCMRSRELGLGSPGVCEDLHEEDCHSDDDSSEYYHSH